MRVLVTTSRCPSPVAGVEVMHVPALRSTALEIPELPSTFEAIFSSRNAVRAVADSLSAESVKHVWALGEATAQEVRRVLPGVPVTTADSAYFPRLVALLKANASAEPRVSFELEDGPRTMASELPGVRCVTAYRSVSNAEAVLLEAIRDFAPDWVIVGSPRGVDVIHAEIDLTRFQTAAIGETTAEAMTLAKCPADHIARNPLLESLISDLKALTPEG